MKKGLLIVDVQNDFCPGGALATKNGNKIVPIINSIMDKFDLVISSQDWHPVHTVHFKKWPVHCVRNTFGAEIHSGIDKEKIDFFLLKGTDNKDDGYSAFEATNIVLTDFLHERQITDLYVCGIATDYCVKATALDSVDAGFRTFLIVDAVSAVNINPDDEKNALDEMKKRGIRLISSSDI